MNIPDIIVNSQHCYLGDLRHYFRLFMKDAKNLSNSYHNFRHILHVLFLCYDACVFYGDKLALRQKRNLLIAALYHDFDHPGRVGHDDLNIEIALRGLRRHIQDIDKEHLEQIARIIRPTEFPYKCPSSELCLEAQILRDADASQALSIAWIQQVIFGLGEEMGIGWKAVLGMQETFLGKLTFSTDWAREKFPQGVIQAKIEEAKGIMALL